MSSFLAKGFFGILMKRKPLFLGLLGLTLLVMLLMPMVFYWVETGPYYGREENNPAPGFTLLDTQNQPHRLAEHRGKFTFLYFGYLNCDKVCHNQVGVMFNINHQTDNTDLDFIFVTMDPKRDTNEMLNDYFNQFGKNFFALTATSMQEIQKVASSYKAYFFADGSTEKGKDYEISHPGNIFLIDPDGQIRMVYQNTYLRYDKVIEDLNLLRAQYAEKS